MKQLTPGLLLTDTATGLSYRLMQPQPPTPQRCLVLLHGVGSNELSVARLADGVRHGTLVVLVRGTWLMGGESFAWFEVEFTPSGPRIAWEQAEQSRQKLIQLLSKLRDYYGVAADQTIIAGFSQGGIMSAAVALTSPESVGGFGLLSGRILPEIEPLLAGKERLASLSGFVGHGELDPKLPVGWAQSSHDTLEKLGVRHTYRLYPIGHSVSAPMQADFVRWLSTVWKPTEVPPEA